MVLQVGEVEHALWTPFGKGLVTTSQADTTLWGLHPNEVNESGHRSPLPFRCAITAVRCAFTACQHCVKRLPVCQQHFGKAMHVQSFSGHHEAALRGVHLPMPYPCCSTLLQHRLATMRGDDASD